MTETYLRRRFALTLSGLAAVYGAVWTYRLLGFQSDSVTDILKFSGLIFFGTLFFSYIWWRLIRSKLSGLKSGALAGLLTAICIIPVPTLVGSMKAQLTQGEAFSTAVGRAIHFSISTYSLAEFLVIPLSMAVGMWAAWQKA